MLIANDDIAVGIHQTNTLLGQNILSIRFLRSLNLLNGFHKTLVPHPYQELKANELSHF